MSVRTAADLLDEVAGGGEEEERGADSVRHDVVIILEQEKSFNTKQTNNASCTKCILIWLLIKRTRGMFEWWHLVDLDEDKFVLMIIDTLSNSALPRLIDLGNQIGSVGEGVVELTQVTLTVSPTHWTPDGFQTFVTDLTINPVVGWMTRSQEKWLNPFENHS